LYVFCVKLFILIERSLVLNGMADLCLQFSSQNFWKLVNCNILMQYFSNWSSVDSNTIVWNIIFMNNFENRFTFVKVCHLWISLFSIIMTFLIWCLCLCLSLINKCLDMFRKLYFDLNHAQYFQSLKYGNNFVIFKAMLRLLSQNTTLSVVYYFQNLTSILTKDWTAQEFLLQIYLNFDLT
jgi:hypothetical protein